MKNLPSLLLALFAVACAHAPATPRAAPVVRLETRVLEEADVNHASASRLEEPFAQASLAAASTRGWRVADDAPRRFQLTLLSFDASQMRSARSVRIEIGVREERPRSPPREWRFGPVNVRVQNHVAEYELEAYLREAVGRIFDEGPPAAP